MSEDQTSKWTLQRLYELEQIETVHAVSEARSVDISVDIGDNIPRTLHLPAGSYLVLRVVDAPVAKAGLYAIVAPRPTADANTTHRETLGSTLGGNGKS